MGEFIAAIKFVFTSTYFTFNHVIYKQTFGTPVGPPCYELLLTLLCIVIQRESVLKSINLCY